MLKITENHCRDCGAAVNVKFYDGVSVALDSGSTETQRDSAWEDAQNMFWNEAERIAESCGFDGVAACGRSGGWCAPYYNRGTSKRLTFADLSDPDDDARFSAFHARIDALYRRVPDLFADALRDAMDMDEQADERALVDLVARDDAALASILVRVVGYSRSDYSGTDSIYPQDVAWNVSYVCSCFLAQGTRDGRHGVPTECALDGLGVMRDMPPEDRRALALRMVQEYGGAKPQEVHA